MLSTSVNDTVWHSVFCILAIFHIQNKKICRSSQPRFKTLRLAASPAHSHSVSGSLWQSGASKREYKSKRGIFFAQVPVEEALQVYNSFWQLYLEARTTMAAREDHKKPKFQAGVRIFFHQDTLSSQALVSDLEIWSLCCELEFLFSGTSTTEVVC